MTYSTTYLEEKRLDYRKLSFIDYVNTRKSFNHKVVISGNTLEYYRHEKRVGTEKYTRTDFKKRSIDEVLTDYQENPEKFVPVANSSFRRSRSTITRLIYSNEKKFKSFLTLTFKENLTDLKKANLHFKKFIMRLKTKYPDLVYIGVPEFQKRGAVHYHLLTSIDVSGYKDIFAFERDFGDKIWKGGFVKFSNLVFKNGDFYQVKQQKRVENIGFYISKYIGKDLFDLRYFGSRKVLYSKNLLKPFIFTGIYKVKQILNSLDFFNFTPVFESVYQNIFKKGKIAYKMYKLKDLPVFPLSSII
jgi:hypothetical protein